MANIFQPNSSSSSSSGSGTGKNYLSTYNSNTGNGDFETGGTTGWSLAHSSLTTAFPSTVGTAGTAFSSAGGAGGGSAANANLSLTASSSSPIAGVYSGVYASSSATTAGDLMISSAFTIDTEDQAKVMTFSFYYSATVNPSNGNWSGTSSNSFGVAIYDVTNALWIMPAGVWGMTQSTLSGYCTGTFQTTSNSTQYQLAVFNANASANAITLKFDDLLVGPQTAPFGPAMTDWVTWTPTFGGAGTPTSVSFFSRRVADSLEGHGRFNTGTVGASTAFISLGFNGINGNVLIDSSKIGTTYTIVGSAVFAGTGAATEHIMTFAGSTVLYMSNTAASSTGLIAALGNNAWANTQAQSVYFRVPIQGWSSNVMMSQDTDTRVVAARMTGAAATITGTYSDITWTTVANDTHGGMGAISYTVPVTGYYDIIGAIDIGAGSLSAAGGFFVGLNTGSVILENKFIFDLNVPENESLDFNYGSVYLNAGATFKLQVKTTGTVGTPVINSSATTNFLAIKRLSGPSVISATETIAARYYASATSISGSLATVVWTTKDYDTHNSMSSGVYTIPVSGKYQVNTLLINAIGGAASLYAVDLELQKNSVLVSNYNAATHASTTSGVVSVICDVINCNAGDTIRVQYSCSGNTPTIVSSNTRNFFSIVRVGN